MYNGLAKTLFGSDDPLDQVKLSRFLIGAVARAMQPGCKMDNALVIRGKQGTQKTSLLSALFGEHFQTLHSHQETLEQQRNIQLSWGLEMGEIEATFGAKPLAALKAFMTDPSDTYRDLYDKKPVKRDRHSVIAGTTNERTFLTDPTGSRRFWVIDGGDYKIPAHWAKDNRDRIWATALELYNQGEPWWMTEEEEHLSEVANQVYQTENPLKERLSEYLEILEEGFQVTGEGLAIKATEAMYRLLGIKVENQSKHKKTFASAMESLGYVKKAFNNKTLRGDYYVKAETQTPKPLDHQMLSRLANLA
jgi:predicted P-loop ATPase